MCLTGCIQNGTTQQNIEYISPYVTDISSISIFVYLNNIDKEDGQKFVERAEIYVAAVDGLVVESGSIDLAGLQSLAEKYLGPKYSPLSDILLSIAEREINRLPQVQEPEERVESIRLICKAVVDGLKAGLENYKNIQPVN